MGLRVLAIDLDYQGSLSEILLRTVEETSSVSGISKLLSTGDHQIIFSDDVIVKVPGSNLSLISASLEFSNQENRLLLRWLLERDKDDIRYRLAYHLSAREIRDRYDVILLDTPPRMTAGTFNALTTCSHVVVPTTLKAPSWERVPSYHKLLANIARSYNPRIQIAGIALTLTKSQVLRGSDLLELEAFKDRLRQREISIPIFERHIPRWDALGDVDFTNNDAVSIYDALAREVWSQVNSGLRKAA
jgi:cellulose biosynthesis protein BcsQ